MDMKCDMHGSTSIMAPIHNCDQIAIKSFFPKAKLVKVFNWEIAYSSPNVKFVLLKNIFYKAC